MAIQVIERLAVVFLIKIFINPKRNGFLKYISVGKTQRMLIDSVIQNSQEAGQKVDDNLLI